MIYYKHFICVKNVTEAYRHDVELMYYYFMPFQISQCPVTSMCSELKNEERRLNSNARDCVLFLKRKRVKSREKLFCDNVFFYQIAICLFLNIVIVDCGASFGSFHS